MRRGRDRDGVRFDREVSAWCDGGLDPAAAEELLARVAADPALRRRYLAIVEVHALLHWHGARGARVDGSEVLRPDRALPFGALALAATVLVAVLATPWFRGRAAPDGPVVTRSVGAVWAGDQLEPGRPLPAGARLRLMLGLAEFRCADGATLVLDGPGSLGFDADGVPRLDAGRLAVRGVGPSTRIATPDGLVTVGAATLGVTVGDGATEVDAREAAVDVAPRDAAAVELPAATWLRLEAGRIAARGAPPDDHRLPRWFPEVTGIAEAALARPGFVTWRGDFDGSGAWLDAARWSDGAVPDASRSVRISRRATVAIDGAAAARELFVGLAELRIRDGRLAVGGSIELGLHRPGAALRVASGDLSVGGRLVVRRDCRLELEAGRVAVAGEVLLFDPGAELRLATGAQLEARAVLGLRDGITTHVVVAAAPASGPLATVRDGLALGGALEFAFPAGEATPRRDVVLFAVDATAPLVGAFTGVRDGDPVFRWSDGARLVFRSGARDAEPAAPARGAADREGGARSAAAVVALRYVPPGG